MPSVACSKVDVTSIPGLRCRTLGEGWSWKPPQSRCVIGETSRKRRRVGRLDDRSHRHVKHEELTFDASRTSELDVSWYCHLTEQRLGNTFPGRDFRPRTSTAPGKGLKPREMEFIWTQDNESHPSTSRREQAVDSGENHAEIAGRTAAVL